MQIRNIAALDPEKIIYLYFFGFSGTLFKKYNKEINENLANTLLK